MELEVTVEKVTEAAKTCPDADRVLRALFPEAFATPRYIPTPGTLFTTKEYGTALFVAVNEDTAAQLGKGYGYHSPKDYVWAIHLDTGATHALPKSSPHFTHKR